MLVTTQDGTSFHSKTFLAPRLRAAMDLPTAALLLRLPNDGGHLRRGAAITRAFARGIPASIGLFCVLFPLLGFHSFFFCEPQLPLSLERVIEQVATLVDATPVSLLRKQPANILFLAYYFSLHMWHNCLGKGFHLKQPSTKIRGALSRGKPLG